MANQGFIRNMNQRRILTLLRREGGLSRAEIARRLSLTRSAVTYLADGLLNEQLVGEVAGDAAELPREAGRPGVTLSIHPAGNYFLGAEIGVTVMRFALVDMTLTPVKTKTMALRKPPSPAEAIRAIDAFLTACGAEKRIGKRIRAIGITVPGLVRGDGMVLHLPILGWRDVNLLALARKAFRIPVAIDNDTNGVAFGEVYRHPKLSHDLVLFLRLGNGCGGAAIVEGNLLRGTSGVAAEFGHMRIADHGPLCHCGQRGCLETYVNLTALSRYLTEAEARVGPDPVQVAAAIGAGNSAAGAAVERLGVHLATGIISLTNIFNPSDIVLGGAMLPVLAVGLERLRATVAAGIVAGMQAPNIALSGGDAFECAIGAAAIAHHAQFDVSALSVGDKI